MSKNYFEDDNGNRSSMRLNQFWYTVVIITLLGVWAGVFLREALAGSGNYTGLDTILGILLGGGSLNLLWKAVQKKFETSGEQETPKPVKKDPEDDPPKPQPMPQGLSIVIDRIFSNHHKTLSNCGVWDGGQFLFLFKGIELPWKDNLPFVSCITAGKYQALATRRSSNRKYAIWIKDVVGRTEIMMHTANYVRQLEGCHAPGTNFADLDNDGIIDVANSQKIMDVLQSYFPENTEFDIWFIDSWKTNGNTKPQLP